MNVVGLVVKLVHKVAAYTVEFTHSLHCFVSGQEVLVFMHLRLLW